MTTYEKLPIATDPGRTRPADNSEILAELRIWGVTLPEDSCPFCGGNEAEYLMAEMPDGTFVAGIQCWDFDCRRGALGRGQSEGAATNIVIDSILEYERMCLRGRFMQGWVAHLQEKDARRDRGFGIETKFMPPRLIHPDGTVEILEPKDLDPHPGKVK